MKKDTKQTKKILLSSWEELLMENLVRNKKDGLNL